MNDKLKDLDEKIKQFKAQDAAPRDKEAEKLRDAANMNAGLRAGTELIVSIAGGGVIGWFLDDWLGTKPLFLILFVFAGIGAGFMNIYRITQNIGGSPGYTSLHNQEKDAKKAPKEDS